MPEQPNLSATTSSFLNEMSSQLTRKSFCHSILWDCYVFLVLCCCIDHIFLQLASLCQNVSSLWFVRWTMTGMELLQSYCLADHLYSSHPRELTATQRELLPFCCEDKGLWLGCKWCFSPCQLCWCLNLQYRKRATTMMINKTTTLARTTMTATIVGPGCLKLNCPTWESSSSRHLNNRHLKVHSWSRNWLRGRITLAQRKRKKKPITITNLAGYYTNE